MSFCVSPDATRRRSLGCLLTLLAAPFSGVAPAVASSERGRTLTVAAFPAVDKIVAAAIPAWNKLHPDVELRLISRQRDDHHTAMTTALSTSAGLPDVMALEVPYLGRFKQGLGLEDLRAKPYDVEQLRSRLVPYAYQQATNKRGEVVGLPSDIGPGTLLYRHDVLSRAGLTEAQLTNTWDGFVESGVRIKASTGAYLLAHARDIKDIVIRAGIPPGAGLFFDQQSRVLVNTPRFHRAFALAKAVRAGKLDARVNAWSSDWAEGFKRGSIASQMMGAWLAGHLNSWLAPSTRGLWRAAQLPEGAYAAFGGTFFAMPRRGDAARKALAWDFLRLMALDRHQQLTAFKEQDAFPALVETFSDPFFEEPLPFLGGQRARLLWRDAAQRITAFNVHKQDAFADEVINTELDKVLDRGKDIATALGDAERLLKQRAMR